MSTRQADATKGYDGSTEIRGLADLATGLCLLVIAKGVVRTYALPESGQVTMGRSEACDIRIDDPSISRRHATLYIERASAGPPSTRSGSKHRARSVALAIEDRGSANGTFLRGPRALPSLVRPPRPTLDPDDDAVPSSREGRESARQLAPGQPTSIAVGDFVDLGATLLVVWPASPERAGKIASAKPPPGTVVRDDVMLRLHEIVARVARGNIGVILAGESGVGKELCAEALHRASSRASKPFLAVGCASMSESALESELFGRQKGALAGAPQAKTGVLERAEGGTVFLDEVGALAMPMQGKLARAIERRELVRVGGVRPRPFDVRFVAATSKDLEAEVTRGLFREDLFFRLNGISLVIPPLRDRLVELPDLARTFAAAAARAAGMPTPVISDEAMLWLERHRWPGNVRELRTVIERAVLLADRGVIGPEHLPSQCSHQATTPIPAAPESAERVTAPRALKADVEAYERQQIALALEQCGGNQTRAAKLLGISRRTLTTRLGQYELPRPRKRRSPS